MQPTIAPAAVRNRNRRTGAAPAAPVPLVSPDQRARYDTALELAAALEGLFPVTPAEYAEAAGVAAVLEASRR